MTRTFSSLSPNHLPINVEYSSPINPTVSDLAFNEFRKGFPYIKCKVLEGEEMVYWFRSKAIIRAKELAEHIIKEKNLPLIVVQSNFISDKLIIKYVEGINACKRIMSASSHV